MNDDDENWGLFLWGVGVGVVFILLLFISFVSGVKTADTRVTEKCSIGATIIIEGKAYECVSKEKK